MAEYAVYYYTNASFSALSHKEENPLRCQGWVYLHIIARVVAVVAPRLKMGFRYIMLIPRSLGRAVFLLCPLGSAEKSKAVLSPLWSRVLQGSVAPVLWRKRLSYHFLAYASCESGRGISDTWCLLLGKREVYNLS